MRFFIIWAVALLTACSACATTADAPPAPPPPPKACRDVAMELHAAHIAAGRELVDQMTDGESGQGVYWDRKSPTAQVELFVPADTTPPPEAAKLYKPVRDCILPTGKPGRYYHGEVPVVSDPMEALLQQGEKS